MQYIVIKNKIANIYQTKNWRNLTKLIDDGYKGIFVILRILQESECDVTAGELAKKMNVSTARIARALNTLEEKGYIMRLSEKTDARKVVIRLTKQGELALNERKKSISATLEPMFENLTEEETDVFFSLLNKILQ